MRLTQNEMRLDVVVRAARFAFAAHFNQQRKYTGVPYFDHCESVANKVEARGGDKYMIAAAYLHDTLEDTDATVEELRKVFPPIVVDTVIGLTDVYTKEEFPYLNRAERKGLEVKRYASESAHVQAVKLCDLADNTSDIVEYDPKFAIIYLTEKVELLKVFRSSVLNGSAFKSAYQ